MSDQPRGPLDQRVDPSDPSVDPSRPGLGMIHRAGQGLGTPGALGSVAAFNVNSIRARIDSLGAWLDRAGPDVVCLSETRCGPDDFPVEVFTTRGYEVAWADDGPGLPKGRNGVAVASRRSLKEVARPLDELGRWSAWDDDWPQGEGRLLVATVDTAPAPVTIAALYVPNGRSLDHWHYAYKLAWLDSLTAWTQAVEGPLVVAGDFNVAPHDCDVWNPKAWLGRTHVSDAERERIAALCGERPHVGDTAADTTTANGRLVDLWRSTHREALEAGVDGDGHTWWNYRSGGYERRQGLRIDLILASGDLAASLQGVTIDHETRGGPAPSDHAPLVAAFA